MPEEFVEDIIESTAAEEKAAEEAAVVKAAKESKAIEEAAKAEEQKQQEQETADKEKAVQEQKAAQQQAAQEQKPVEGNEAIEKLAEQLGWNKDHKGTDAVDAATYILRSREIQDTMRDHNKDLKGQVSSLQKSISALQEHNENVYKVEVKKLENELTRLKKEKRAAVELADTSKVDELDEQIESIQKDLNKPQKVTTNKVVANPVYDEWIKDNEWYETDDEMAAYADKVAEKYEGAPLERIYLLVRKNVEEVFPEKFKSNDNTKLGDDIDPNFNDDGKKAVGPSSPVEAGNNREKQSSFTINDLTPEQRSIMQQFVKQGIMTEKKYIADIEKLQEV